MAIRKQWEVRGHTKWKKDRVRTIGFVSGIDSKDARKQARKQFGYRATITSVTLKA